MDNKPVVLQSPTQMQQIANLEHKLQDLDKTGIAEGPPTRSHQFPWQRQSSDPKRHHLTTYFPVLNRRSNRKKCARNNLLIRDSILQNARRPFPELERILLAGNRRDSLKFYSHVLKPQQMENLKHKLQDLNKRAIEEARSTRPHQTPWGNDNHFNQICTYSSPAGHTEMHKE